MIPRAMDNYTYAAKKALDGFEDDREHGGASSAWEEIMVDPDVVRTHAALLAILERDPESTQCGSAARLLNPSNIHVYKQLRPTESQNSTRIFGKPRTRAADEFLDTMIEPEHFAYLGTLRDLEHAVNDAHHRRVLQWPEMERVGEAQRPDGDDSGIVPLRSCTTTPDARGPDLPTAHGSKVPKRQILFVRLNACDTSATDSAECDTPDSWIACAVTRYLTDDRNPTLRYNARQAELVRCSTLSSASPSREGSALSPLCIARALGPTTFATSQLSVGPTFTAAACEAVYIHDIKCFRELSWKEEGARSKEKTLPQLPRKKGWFTVLDRLCKNEAGDIGLPVSAHAKPSACIVVTDMDHAIEQKLLKPSPEAVREQTGTPMFMSVELSDYSIRGYDPTSPFLLEDAMHATTEIPKDILLLAFPGGENDFMVKFDAVMKIEANRRRPKPLPSLPPHILRHDAESAFWVFFWAVVRALPRNTGLQPSAAEIDEFSDFCEKMLNHVIDEKKSDKRDAILTSSFARLFHPALRQFVGLFKTVALYLNVPWHYYEAEGKVGPDHAHVAFQRLLLHFLLDLETVNAAMLDLRINTEHPRIMAWTELDGTRWA